MEQAQRSFRESIQRELEASGIQLHVLATVPINSTETSNFSTIRTPLEDVKGARLYEILDKFVANIILTMKNMNNRGEAVARYSYIFVCLTHLPLNQSIQVQFHLCNVK